MTKEKKVNIIVILLVALGVLYLIQNADVIFPQATVTATTNLEPLSISDWQNRTELLNGTFKETEPFLFNDGNQTIILNQYEVIGTPLGELSISDTKEQGYNCNEVLANLKQNGTSYYSLIEKRQVLIVLDGFLWCNYNNKLLLSSPDVTTINRYYDEYLEITTQDIGIDKTECIAAGGSWDGNICICPSGVFLTESGSQCPDVNETYQQTTSTTSTQSTTDSTEKEKDPLLMYILFVLGALILIYYFGFEMGPNKGFIKKKSRKKK